MSAGSPRARRGPPQRRRLAAMPLRVVGRATAAYRARLATGVSDASIMEVEASRSCRLRGEAGARPVNPDPASDETCRVDAWPASST